jgi:hypothetical protein
VTRKISSTRKKKRNFFSFGGEPAVRDWPCGANLLCAMMNVFRPSSAVNDSNKINYMHRSHHNITTQFSPPSPSGVGTHIVRRCECIFAIIGVYSIVIVSK